MLLRLFTIHGMSNRSTRVPAHGCPSRRRGFTLVELMVTMVIVAILMTLAVPGMQQFLLRRAVIAHTDSLVSSIRYARSEALKGGLPVTVCNTADADAAAPVCVGAAGDWASGWLVFVDRDGDGVIAPADRLLQVQQAYGNSGGIDATRGFVTFNSTGIAFNGVANFVARPALPEDHESYVTYTRTVCVSRPGRARVVPGEGCPP